MAVIRKLQDAFSNDRFGFIAFETSTDGTLFPVNNSITLLASSLMESFSFKITSESKCICPLENTNLFDLYG